MLDFNCWLESLERKISGLSARLQLKTVASLVRFDYEAVLWFVRIQGKRWSHVAGDILERPQGTCICQLTLDDNFGVVIASPGRLREHELTALCEFINRRILRPEAASIPSPPRPSTESEQQR